MGVDGPDYLLLVALVAPQILVAVYTFRRRRRLRWFVRTALVVVPALAFWLISDLHFVSVAREVRSHGVYVCGAFGFMAVFVVIGGTLAQVVLGTIIQACHAALTRLQERRLRNVPRVPVAV